MTTKNRDRCNMGTRIVGDVGGIISEEAMPVSDQRDHMRARMNTTPKAMADADRRVEIMAARHTALELAIGLKRHELGMQELIVGAVRFENFLLDHPASGEQALRFAVGRSAGRSFLEIIEAAQSFAAYLDRATDAGQPTDAGTNAR